jgi:hypothetical protein
MPDLVDLDDHAQHAGSCMRIADESAAVGFVTGAKASSSTIIFDDIGAAIDVGSQAVKPASTVPVRRRRGIASA